MCASATPVREFQGRLCRRALAAAQPFIHIGQPDSHVAAEGVRLARPQTNPGQPFREGFDGYLKAPVTRDRTDPNAMAARFRRQGGWERACAGVPAERMGSNLCRDFRASPNISRRGVP